MEPEGEESKDWGPVVEQLALDRCALTNFMRANKPRMPFRTVAKCVTAWADVIQDGLGVEASGYRMDPGSIHPKAKAEWAGVMKQANHVLRQTLMKLAPLLAEEIPQPGDDKGWEKEPESEIGR